MEIIIVLILVSILIMTPAAISYRRDRKAISAAINMPIELDADPDKVRKLERELGIMTLDDIPVDNRTSEQVVDDLLNDLDQIEVDSFAGSVKIPARRPQDVVKPDPNSLDGMYPLPEGYKWLITSGEDARVYIALVTTRSYEIFAEYYGPNGGHASSQGMFTGYEDKYRSLIDFMRGSGYIKLWDFTDYPKTNQANLAKYGEQLYLKLKSKLAEEEAETKRKAALNDFVKRAAGKQDPIKLKRAPKTSFSSGGYDPRKLAQHERTWKQVKGNMDKRNKKY